MILSQSIKDEWNAHQIRYWIIAFAVILLSVSVIKELFYVTDAPDTCLDEIMRAVLDASQVMSGAAIGALLGFELHQRNNKDRTEA